MKIEHFPIEGIPEGYRVFDVDLTPSGEPVIVLGHESNSAAPAFARIRDTSISLPSGSIIYVKEGGTWESGAYLYVKVRAIGDAGVVAVLPGADRDAEINGWAWSRSGRPEAEFHAGDGVLEVLASEDHIVLFYSDQGQTGDVSLSREAVAVMSPLGRFLWGHSSQFPDEPLAVWFHSAAWSRPPEVLLFADVEIENWRGLIGEAGCSFIRLNVAEKWQEISKPPGSVARPDAVSSTGDSLVLSVPPWAASFRTAAPSEGQAVDFVQWKPGEPGWQVIGSYPYHRFNPFRGLPGGRFIAVKPDGYEIMTFP